MSYVRGVVAALVVLTGACATIRGGIGDSAATALEVEVGRDSIRLGLHVTNPTRDTLYLQFSTAQRYEFIVRSAGGAEVWRWSAGRAFGQAVGHEAIAPGASARYEAWWKPGNLVGTFEAEGRVTATNVELSQRASFAVER